MGRMAPAAALLLAGCALFGRPREDPAAVAARDERDARIQAEVAARLAAEPAVDASGIRVEVEGGEVRLHGGVRGFGALQCAMRNAELTPGVRLVIDFLVLEDGPAEVRCLAPRVFWDVRAPS